MEKIAQELKMKILARLQAERESRDKLKEKVSRLEGALDENEGKTEDLKKKILTLNSEIADLIGEGQDATKKRNKLQKARGEIEEISGLIEQIKSFSLPTAREKLKESSGELGAVVKVAILEEQEAFRAKMEDHARGLMIVYNAIVEGQRAVFEELGLPSMAGTAELIPHIQVPELFRYVQVAGVGVLEKP